MKNHARIILTRKCPRKCPGCCNEQFNFDGDVKELSYPNPWKDLEQYDTIVLTGGEPLLVADEMVQLIDDSWGKYKQMKKFVLYTSYSTLIERYKLGNLLQRLDGITFSIHYENWRSNVKELQVLQQLLKDLPIKGKCHDYDIEEEFLFDARLSIDGRIEKDFFQFIDKDCWSNIKVFDWLPPEECPPPDTEDLFFMPLD